MDGDIQQLFPDEWSLVKAPPSNDIIWDHMSYTDRHFKTFIRLITWVLLLVISIVLITPLTIIDHQNPILELIGHYVGDVFLVKSYVQYFLTPI